MAEGPKVGKGDRKCRKTLLKMGMKQFDGVTRVTLRKRDGMVFVVNDPQVLQSEDGNSFAILGELTIDNPSQRMQQAEASKYAEAQRAAQAAMQAAQAQKAAAGKSADATKTDDGPALSEEGLSAEHIDMIMENTGCTRNTAI